MGKASLLNIHKNGSSFNRAFSKLIHNLMQYREQQQNSKASVFLLNPSP